MDWEDYFDKEIILKAYKITLVVITNLILWFGIGFVLSVFTLIFSYDVSVNIFNLMLFLGAISSFCILVLYLIKELPNSDKMH